MAYPIEGALYYFGFENQKCEEDRSCTLTASSYKTKRRADESSNEQAPDNSSAIKNRLIIMTKKKVQYSIVTLCNTYILLINSELEFDSIGLSYIIVSIIIERTNTLIISASEKFMTPHSTIKVLYYTFLVQQFDSLD